MPKGFSKTPEETSNKLSEHNAKYWLGKKRAQSTIEKVKLVSSINLWIKSPVNI